MYHHYTHVLSFFSLGIFLGVLQFLSLHQNYNLKFQTGLSGKYFILSPYKCILFSVLGIFSWGSLVLVPPPKPQFEIPNRPEWKILYAIITHVHTFFFFCSAFLSQGFFLCSPVFDLPPKPLFEILRRPRCMHLVKRCVFGSLKLHGLTNCLLSGLLLSGDSWQSLPD